MPQIRSGGGDAPCLLPRQLERGLDTWRGLAVRTVADIPAFTGAPNAADCELTELNAPIFIARLGLDELDFRHDGVLRFSGGGARYDPLQFSGPCFGGGDPFLFVFGAVVYPHNALHPVV